MLARYVLLALTSLVPLGSLRRLLYRRLFGFKLGKGARIAMLNFLDIGQLELGDGAALRGLGNVFLSVNRVTLGDHAAIGAPRIGLNLFRGTRNKPHYPQSALRLGSCSRIELMHYFDLCGDVDVGCNVVVGGIKSVFFTHTFHKSEFEPVRIGDNCYIGSNCLFQMGASIPADSMVGMGSVVTKQLVGENCFIAGVPAQVVKEKCGYSAREAFALRKLPFHEPINAGAAGRAGES